MKAIVLLLDAGNTRLKWAIADLASSDGEYLRAGVVGYVDIEKEFARLAAEFTVDAVLVSCVAGMQKRQSIFSVCNTLNIPEPLFAKVAHRACGLSNNYSVIKQLGVDRWVAAVGALQVSGSGHRLIVDAGTAVTVDYVDADNVFQGGVILPGSKLMHDSLVGKTAGIQSQLDDAVSVLGKNTQECVNAGALYGWAGAVERVMQELVAMVRGSESWQMMLCGGDAERLSSVLNSDFFISHEFSCELTHRPNLIFIGLQSLWRSGELA